MAGDSTDSRHLLFHGDRLDESTHPDEPMK
jgi:hypothetical protein